MRDFAIMITLDAKAKINLTLDILGKRDDGYHEVEMVMQTISLADEVMLEEADTVTVETTLPELNNEKNLAYRAAVLLKERCGVDRGVHIRIKKRIPLAAGLAGGSSDAAAVLKGLNRLWGLRLSLAELSEIGAQLGSDVPFCLVGGTKLAAGRGEELMGVPSLGAVPVVIVKPPIEVSTAWAYQNYRAENVAAHPDAADMIAALASEDITKIMRRMGNVLETVTIPAYPQIKEIKEALVKAGADIALMSGSGPTVFAFVSDEETAGKIAAKMRRKFADHTITTAVTC